MLAARLGTGAVDEAAVVRKAAATSLLRDAYHEADGAAELVATLRGDPDPDVRGAAAIS